MAWRLVPHAYWHNQSGLRTPPAGNLDTTINSAKNNDDYWRAKHGNPLDLEIISAFLTLASVLFGRLSLHHMVIPYSKRKGLLAMSHSTYPINHNIETSLSPMDTSKHQRMNISSKPVEDQFSDRIADSNGTSQWDTKDSATIAAMIAMISGLLVDIPWFLGKRKHMTMIMRISWYVFKNIGTEPAIPHKFPLLIQQG